MGFLDLLCQFHDLLIIEDHIVVETFHLLVICLEHTEAEGMDSPVEEGVVTGKTGFADLLVESLP